MNNVNANPTESRKRVRNSDNWVRNVPKRFPNNIVPTKKFENEDCRCQKKCTDKVDGNMEESLL